MRTDGRMAEEHDGSVIRFLFAYVHIFAHEKHPLAKWYCLNLTVSTTTPGHKYGTTEVVGSPNIQDCKKKKCYTPLLTMETYKRKYLLTSWVFLSF